MGQRGGRPVPLRGSVALWRGGRLLRRDQTDIRGTFVLAGLAPGRYVLQASALGHVDARRPLVVRADLSLGALLLEGHALLHGYLLDGAKRPVAGARLTLIPRRRGVTGVEVRSHEDGLYLAEGLAPGRYDLRVEAPGFSLLRRDGLELPRRRLDLRLAPTYGLRGRVVDGAGRGVERCQVVVVAAGSARRHRGRCDENGRFAVEGLPRGLYELWARSAKAPWLATAPAVDLVVPATRSEPLALKASPASRATGRVVADESGAPLEGARISLRPLVPALLSARAQTNASGAFELPALPAGRFRLQAWAKGRRVLTLGEVVLPLKRPLTLRLRRGYTLAGRIVDERGEPVARAVVRAVVEPRVSPSRGRHRGASRRPRPQSAPRLAPRAGLRLAPRAGLRAVGELGVMPGPIPPIPKLGDAGASVPPTALWTASSDRRGRFRLSGLPGGRLQLLVSHPRYQLLSGPWVPVEGKALPEQRLTLSPAAELLGTLQDDQGRPIVGARIRARATVGRGKRRLWTAYSDDRGRFRFGALVGETSLEVLASGYAPKTRTVTLQVGLSRQITVVLGAEGEALRGVVGDEAGKPLARVTVSLRCAEGGPVVARSDRRGRFRLALSGRPPCELEAQGRGYAAHRARYRRLPRRALALTLRRPSTIRGRVQDWRTGVALRRFSVRERAAIAGRSFSGRRGRFTLELAPGRRQLLVSAPGYLTRQVAIHVEPRRRAYLQRELRVELREAGAIRGVVRDAFGRPVKGARLSAGAASATSDGAGRFALEKVAPGRVIVTLRLGARALRSAPVFVRAGETAGPLRLELPR